MLFDLEKAQAFVTEETKHIFIRVINRLKNAPGFQEKLTAYDNLTRKEIESYRKKIVFDSHIDELIEVINDDKAVVKGKGESDGIELKYEQGSWRIPCTEEDLYGALEVYPYKNLNDALSNLINQYQRRMDLTILIFDLIGASKNELTRQKIIEAKGIDVSNSNLHQYLSLQKEIYQLASAQLSATDDLGDPKLNENLIGLENQFQGTENRIHSSIKSYNKTLASYNTYFGENNSMLPLEETNSAEEQPPTIEF